MRIVKMGCMLVSLASSIWAQDVTIEEQRFSPTLGLPQCERLDTTQPLGLEKVVMLSLCNNPQTQMAWQSALYQAALVGVSEASFYPSLSLGGSILKSEGSDTYDSHQNKMDVTFSYLLYDFGKRDATLANAQYLLKAASFSKDNTIQALFLSAVQAYYGLFGAQASLRATQEAELAAKESLSAAKARYTIGTATPSDALQAQTAYSQAVLNRIKAQGNLKGAEGALANVLGASPDTKLILNAPDTTIPSVSFERSIQALMEEAVKMRPDLLSAQAKIKAYQANIEASKAEDKPTFSLSATTGHTDNSVLDHYRNSSIGLYVSIPIFNGHITKYKVQAAKEQLKLSEAEYEKLSNDASLEVYQAYESVLSETEATRASLDLLTSAQASYDSALGRYKAGVGTILDVLNAQSALSSAKQQHVQSLYKWHITKASLAKAMGGLNVKTLKGYNEW